MASPPGGQRAASPRGERSRRHPSRRGPLRLTRRWPVRPAATPALPGDSDGDDAVEEGDDGVDEGEDQRTSWWTGRPAARSSDAPPLHVTM
ncbi:hypothetical protein ABZP36_006757 [Zizania latifolia]